MVRLLDTCYRTSESATHAQTTAALSSCDETVGSFPSGILETADNAYSPVLPLQYLPAEGSGKGGVLDAAGASLALCSGALDLLRALSGLSRSLCPSVPVWLAMRRRKARESGCA